MSDPRNWFLTTNLKKENWWKHFRLLSLVDFISRENFPVFQSQHVFLHAALLLMPTCGWINVQRRINFREKCWWFEFGTMKFLFSSEFLPFDVDFLFMLSKYFRCSWFLEPSRQFFLGILDLISLFAVCLYWRFKLWI